MILFLNSHSIILDYNLKLYKLYNFFFGHWDEASRADLELRLADRAVILVAQHLLFQQLELDDDQSIRVGEFEAVGDEVEQNLEQPLLVAKQLGEDVRFALLHLQVQIDILGFGLERHDLEGFFDDLDQVEVVVVQLEYLLFQFRMVEQVVDEVGHHEGREDGVLGELVPRTLHFAECLQGFEEHRESFLADRAPLIQLFVVVRFHLLEEGS